MKLVEVVTVADVDAEKRVDNSLVQIWELKFDHKLNFCSDFQHKVWHFLIVLIKPVHLPYPNLLGSFFFTSSAFRHAVIPCQKC